MSADIFELMDVGGIFFTIDGYRVRLRGILTNPTSKNAEFVVERMVACDDCDDEYPADTFIVRSLFRNAPIATQSEELKRLVDQIADARAELYDVRTKINETKKGRKSAAREGGSISAPETRPRIY